MSRGRRLLSLLLVALLLGAGALPLSGCRKKKADSLEASRFSEEELWKQAQDYIEREKWKKASTYLKLLLDQYPAGNRAREAHLAYADTLFNHGSDASLIEAQAKYLAFAAFYPEDERAAYAQYRIGLCNYERRGKPDRDQSVTRTAISELEKVAQSYPKSEYVDDARGKVRELRDELAEHEITVATFYRRRGFHGSSAERVKFLLEKYPEYGKLDEAYLLLSRELLKEDNPVEAVAYLEKLIESYPGSELRGDAEDMLEDARSAASKSAEEKSKDDAEEAEEKAREEKKAREKEEKAKAKDKASEPELEKSAPPPNKSVRNP